MQVRRRSRWTVCLLAGVVLAGSSWSARGQQPANAGNPPTVEAPKDVAGFQALESQIKAVVAKALPSMVGIHISGSSGSGVIVSEDGLVMTAGHVVGKPGQDVTFFFSDGKTAKGKTLGMYASADAGMMKITDPGKWPFVEKGQSAALKPGTWCVAIGHPLGYQPGRPPVVRLGRVLHAGDGVIQTDCPLVGGDSGGPLLSLEGKVIGINSRIGGPTDVNLHVPVDIFNANWDRLLKGEAWHAVLPGREGPDVKTPFRQVVAAASQCAVRVKCDGQDAALGTIVGPDGWVLTKASELKGKIVCRLRDGRELEARIVGIQPPCDLAMLKIDAVSLPIIDWSNQQPAVGQWVASAGIGDDPLALGIVSVPRRAIPPAGGVIGIQLSEKDGEATIEKIMPKSPAEKAGLKAGDIVTHVDGEIAHNTPELRALMRRHRPGETVKLTVKRGDQTLEISVQLVKLSSPALQQQQVMNSLGVGVSKRSDDFPAVLQHDTVLKPVDCGGPVVDLSGKVVGVNIAHGGRTETYCIPTDVLVVAMYELMSGRLSPALLEAARKAVEEKAAAEKKAEEEKAAAEKAAAEKAAAEKAAVEKAAAEKKAAEEKAAAEKAAAEKAAAEKAAVEKAAAEKKAAEEKAAAEKAAAEKVAAEKAAVEKKAAEDKAAAEKAAAEKKPDAPK
jgi:serine protease Do